MNDPKLLEVGARLEKAVEPLLNDGMTRGERYEMYEQIAIQILDSEHGDFPEGVLEAHLMENLQHLTKWPHPLKPRTSIRGYLYMEIQDDNDSQQTS